MNDFRKKMPEKAVEKYSPILMVTEHGDRWISNVTNKVTAATKLALRASTTDNMDFINMMLMEKGIIGRI